MDQEELGSVRMARGAGQVWYGRCSKVRWVRLALVWTVEAWNGAGGKARRGMELAWSRLGLVRMTLVGCGLGWKGESW